MLQPWSCSQTAWCPARALQRPGPAPEWFSLGSRTQLRPAQLLGRVEATAMLPGACVSHRAQTLPPQVSLDTVKSSCLQTPHPISFPARARLAGLGNLERLQQSIWQADLSQFFPVQTNVVNWFTKHFILCFCPSLSNDCVYWHNVNIH